MNISPIRGNVAFGKFIGATKKAKVQLQNSATKSSCAVCKQSEICVDRFDKLPSIPTQVFDNGADLKNGAYMSEVMGLEKNSHPCSPEAISYSDHFVEKNSKHD